MRYIRSMASDTDSRIDEPGLALRWSRRWTLAYRILAVNILTVVLLAAGIIYLDAFRNRLSKERIRQTRSEATIAALALSAVPEPAREELPGAHLGEKRVALGVPADERSALVIVHLPSR